MGVPDVGKRATNKDGTTGSEETSEEATDDLCSDILTEGDWKGVMINLRGPKAGAKEGSSRNRKVRTKRK